MSFLELRKVTKRYGEGDAEVLAVQDVDLSVDTGELVAVMGPSGSGKSSLLSIAGTLEDPTSGEVTVGGAPVSSMSRNEKARLRRVLAATGASSWARHALSAATAGGLALLGALLGTVAGYVAMFGWVRGNTVTGGIAALGNVPVANLLLILLGMPAIAVVLGWVLSGRERPTTVQRAIE